MLGQLAQPARPEQLGAFLRTGQALHLGRHRAGESVGTELLSPGEPLQRGPEPGMAGDHEREPYGHGRAADLQRVGQIVDSVLPRRCVTGRGGPPDRQVVHAAVQGEIGRRPRAALLHTRGKGHEGRRVDPEIAEWLGRVDGTRGDAEDLGDLLGDGGTQFPRGTRHRGTGVVAVEEGEKRLRVIAQGVVAPRGEHEQGRAGPPAVLRNGVGLPPARCARSPLPRRTR